MADAPTLPDFIVYADLWCPHSCSVQAPQPGYQVELVRAALPGVRVEYRVAPWARLRGTLMEVDRPYAVLGVGRSAATQSFFHLVKPPVLRSPTCFFVRAQDPWRYTHPEDLLGRTLGVTQGMSYEPRLDAWLATHQPAVRVNAVSGADAAISHLRMLSLGRSDVIVEDRLVVWWWSQGQAERPREAGCLPDEATGDAVHIAVPKQSRDARRWLIRLQDGLARLRRSGEYQSILMRYHVPPDAR